MNIKWNDGDLSCNITGVELVQSGIWPRLKLTFCVRSKIPKVGDFNIFEVTVLQDQMAYEVVKNGTLITGSYYPDAGKEKSSMPSDIFQQCLRVIRRFA